MAATRIQTFVPRLLRLEIPWAHFERLPGALGAILTEAPDGAALLTLPEVPGCALRFVVRDGAAHLVSAQIEGDVRGRFFQQVLGALLIEFRGDLDAEIRWAPRGGTSTVVVTQGETEDPLLASLVAAKDRLDHDPRIEQYLADGRSAWDEYLRLKAGRAARDR